MKPAVWFAELGKLLQQSLEEPKKVYRDEDLRDAEYDTFTDRVLLLAAEQKRLNKERQ